MGGNRDVALDETMTRKTPPTRGHPVDKVVFDKNRDKDGDRVAMLPLRNPKQTKQKTEMAQFEFSDCNTVTSAHMMASVDPP